MQLAKDGCAHNTAVIAKKQTAGKGRLGRTWLSFDGNVALSLVVRPQLDMRTAHRLVSLSAWAVAETFESFGAEVYIKWPNDILIEASDDKRVPKLGLFRKVGGILMEVLSTKEHIDAAIIGIGLNVRRPPVGTELLEQMGFVELDRDDFIERLLAALERNLSADATDYTRVLQKVRERSAFIGRAVQVDLGDRMLCGVMTDHLDDGGLLIQMPNGEHERVYVGDVSLL